MRKKDESEKRKRCNILINDSERELLVEKMSKYGYNNLSAYLRDSGIHERLFVEDIEGKLEINQSVTELINKISDYEYQIKTLLMDTQWSEDQRRMVFNMLKFIDEDLKDLIKAINNILWVSTRKIVTNPNRYAEQLDLFDNVKEGF
jgi:hypothetical protein